MALVLGLSMAAAGCGKYSWGTLSAVKGFKDANPLYAQKDWKKAAEKYEEVVATRTPSTSFPQLATAYFFLGNSYDQLYKPAKQGTPTNDALHPEGDRQLPQGGRQERRPGRGRIPPCSTCRRPTAPTS